MAPVINALLTQSPLLLAIVVVYLLNRKDIKLIEQKIDSINTRFDDQKESINARFNDINTRFDEQRESINARFNDINTRFDEQRESINVLGQKVDTLSGQVHRIEGHLGLPSASADD